jgi:hypothetical protein
MAGEHTDNVADPQTVGDRRRHAAHEAGVIGTKHVLAQPGEVKELHVCMGLNACKGHGRDGSGDMAERPSRTGATARRCAPHWPSTDWIWTGLDRLLPSRGG